MKILWIAVLALAGCHNTSSPSPNGYAYVCVRGPSGCTTVLMPTAVAFGDSHSEGYSGPARNFLYGTVDYVHDWNRDTGRLYNDGNSIQLAERMQVALNAQFYSVILYNAGNHDLKIKHGHAQVALDVYRNEIETAAQSAEQHAAIVIWVDTLPIPAGIIPDVKAGAEKPYNEIADAIAKAHGFYILHLKDAEHIPGNIHYTKSGNEALGRQVADCVLLALSDSESSRCHR